MTNLTALSNITHSDVTHMTLKEITDLLEVRHNDAIPIVERMTENAEFGLATKISYPIISGKGREQLIETYQLNKRQSIAVAAKLNTSLLMRIIDRWQELEQVTQTLADKVGVPKEVLIKDAKDDALLAKLQASTEASKAKIELSRLKVQTAKERDARKLQALKDKLAEQSKVLHARTTKLLSQGAKVKGDMTASKLDLPVDTITNLLKAHGSKLKPSEANNALVNLGYLEPTRDKVTSEGNYYGRTVVSSKSTHTTLARWFPAEFENLLEQINQYYLDKEQGLD